MQHCIPFILLRCMSLPTMLMVTLSLATMNIGFYINCPIFLSSFNQMRIFFTDFHKVPSIKFHKNPSSVTWDVHVHRERHDEVNRCFSWVSTQTQTLKTVTSQYYNLFLFLMSTCQSLLLTKHSQHIKSNYTYSNHRKTGRKLEALKDWNKRCKNKMHVENSHHTDNKKSTLNVVH